MQKFVNQQRYDQPVALVLSKYTDPEFLKRKYEQLGRRDIELLERNVTAEQARMRMAYSDVAGMEVPDFARRFMPERTHVVQSVTWDLVRKTGRIEVETKGAPVSIQGTMQLADDRGGCTNTVTWNVSCSVPLIGGKLEKLLVEGLSRKAKLDEDVTRKLLAE